MNPDELPEREYIQLSYGDYHYRETLVGTRTATLKYHIAAFTMQAMREFHGRYNEACAREAKVRHLLYRLASRYPEIGRDPDFNNYVINGEVNDA